MLKHYADLTRAFRDGTLGVAVKDTLVSEASDAVHFFILTVP